VGGCLQEPLSWPSLLPVLGSYVVFEWPSARRLVISWGAPLGYSREGVIMVLLRKPPYQSTSGRTIYRFEIALVVFFL